MNPAIIAIVVIAVIVAGIIVFMLLNRRGPKGILPVLLSHVVCSRCGFEFDFAWIPGVSFISIRLGKARLFKCPRCGEPSLFNIWDTRVDPETHHCNTRIGPL